MGNRILTLLAAVFALVAGTAQAQQAYPSRPVTLVVPFPAGSTTDLVGRIFGEKLSQRLGQPVVVENIGGAGGINGALSVARAAPDGYRILMGTIGTHSINPALFKDLPYSPLKDFTPLAQFGTAPNVLVVNASLPVKSVTELIEYAKANPGKLNYGSSGIGTSNHLAGALFAARRGLDMVHIPSRGGAQAILDLVRGDIQTMFYHYLPLLPHIREGKLRALAVTSAQRIGALPDVPTMTELGFQDFVISAWFGVYGPADMPKPIVDRLNAEIVAILKDPEMQKTLFGQGVDPITGSPADLAALMRAELERWAKVAADANIKPQ